MKTFIEEIAEKLVAEHLHEFEELSIVFPNRRAGLFLKKALGKIIDKPVWMPKIYSFEDFVLSKSPMKKLDTIAAVFRLYDIYKQERPGAETFDKFFFWGEMIVRDFDEIDQYLVDAEKLFTSIKSQKELDEEFYFLSEEDKSIIQSFWMTFLPESTKAQEAFLETWKILKPVYDAFRKSLNDSSEGYGGLIYRNFLVDLESDKYNFDGQLVFAGFNALTLAEEGIIKYLVRENGAKLFWDTDAYYMQDRQQEAGFFMRQYAQDGLLSRDFPKEYPEGIRKSKFMLATGVSLEVGQAKAMSEHLANLQESGDYDPEKTVVVLPYEYMLFPVLHSLPKGIDQVNITMGMPIKDTPVFSLIESMLVLHQTRRDHLINGTSFYFKPLLQILEHPLIHPVESKSIENLVNETRRRNLIYLHEEDLGLSHQLLQTLVSSPTSPLDYACEVLESLHSFWMGKNRELELEYIARFHEMVVSLREVMGEKSDSLSFDFLVKLIRRLARSLKIPFTGEPLAGLQVMGILETRNLDFDNVFILNMNEDAWPAPPRKGSFIPFNIRKAFGMPVHEHHDAIYAYLFYRLMQRAKNVWFYYNSVSEFNINGEISRLVQQMELESGLTINKRVLANPIELGTHQPIEIKKDQIVFEKLDRFTTEFKTQYMSRLTPSALDTYLQCKLRFYFRYVEEMYEAEDIQEELDAMVFGNILHDTMEILYKQFCNKNKTDVVQPADFFFLTSGVEGAINEAFIKHFQIKNIKKFKLEGRNVIAAEIIAKTARKILEFDQAYAPFRIIGLEASTREGFSLDMPIKWRDRKKVIGLKGKIDRIDIRQGVVRVIDYKTGKDKKEFTSVASFIDPEDVGRNKAAFQVFFYAYLVQTGLKEDYDRIEPGLFNSRDLFQKDFNWQLIQKEGREQTPINSFEQFTDQFEDVLSQLLTEIWNPEHTFTQTEDLKKCGYCSYKEICGRG
ncbi:MAG: PD-(D/E)XK nuclease family protein [Cyclobacteriaceae bacterium]